MGVLNVTPDSFSDGGVYLNPDRAIEHGVGEGVRRTVDMYRSLLRMVWPVGDVRLRTYWFYLRHLSVE